MNASTEDQIVDSLTNGINSLALSPNTSTSQKQEENHTSSTPIPRLNFDDLEENGLQSNEDSTASGSIEKTLEDVLNYVITDLREKVKQYLDNPDSLPQSQEQQQQPFEAFPTSRSGGRRRNENISYLVDRMNGERASTNNQLTKEMLQQPGIYYLKFTTSTGICRGYVGEGQDVYKRVNDHVGANKTKCLIDTQLKKTCEEQSIEKWHLRVVMLKEIQFEGMRYLLKIYEDVCNKKDDEAKTIKKSVKTILTTLETLAIIDLNTLYPKGYNCKLTVTSPIWQSDPILGEQ